MVSFPTQTSRLRESVAWILIVSSKKTNIFLHLSAARFSEEFFECPVQDQD